MLLHRLFNSLNVLSGRPSAKAETFHFLNVFRKCGFATNLRPYFRSILNKPIFFFKTKPFVLNGRILPLFWILTALVFAQNCVRPEVVSAGDSQSQMYAAASYLANKCGTPIPQPFPIIFEEVQQKNLDLCTIAITRSECPFVSYPFACVLLYVDKPLDDIPWYLNFQETFVKTKIQ